MNRNILFTDINTKDINALAKEHDISFNKAVNAIVGAYFGRPTPAIIYEPLAPVKEIKKVEAVKAPISMPTQDLDEYNSESFSLFGKSVVLENFDTKIEE